MEFINKFVDVDRHIGSGEQPVYLMDYTAGEEHHIPHSSLLSDKIEWSVVKSGDKVRIPIFAYRTKEKFDMSLWGLGLQCGMRALDEWGGKPKKVILVFGDKCHEFEDGYRTYLGLSIMRDTDG